MKRLFLFLFLFLAGCDDEFLRIDLGALETEPPRQVVVTEERPRVNPPQGIRQQNWRGSKGQGSCVWASTVTLLRWQGQYEAAEYVRRNYGNGQNSRSFAEGANAMGLQYAMTTNGDVSFLEWAIRTRRGAAVTVMGGRHMLNLIHLDERQACLLDNNNPSKDIWIPRETFLAEWRASGAWALSPVYAPTPPLPQ